MGSLVLGRGGALGQHAFGRVALVKPFVPWRSAAAVHMKAADAPEASALKEDRFYTNDVIAEIATLPSFLQDKPAERWLSEVVAKLALRGCGREEVAWLLSLPVDTINEELPASAGEEQLGSCLLDLAFVPRGAGCGIFGSNSSPQLNERRCTLCRDLSGVETHALVVVEARDGDPPGEYQDAMLIARKNLRFDSIPSRQLTEASQWPNVANMPIPAQEEVQAPSALLGEATPSPACLCTAEALQWLLPCVARLWAAKACVREEIAFLLSLPAEKLGSALPSLGAENLGKFLQDLSFVPQGACCRVEGSTSNARLNGLEGRLIESCPSYSTHAKLLLAGEGEVLIHRKNLRLLALGGVPSQVEKASSGGLCAWLGLRCCDEVRAAPPQRLGPRKDGAFLAGELRRLGEMRASGLLSDVEFHAAKTKCSETRVEGTKSCAMLCAASKAEVLCQQVWQVPAEERTIYFEDLEGGEALRCSVSDGDVVRVLGWEALRLCDGAEGPGVTLSLEGRLPLWWTPAIKALWLPLRVGDGPSPEEPEEGALNLHRLFLSASRVALQWRWPGDDKATTGPADGWPLPLSILADGVKIEICPSFGKL
ncbi:unnamed protein product [Symbiodinium necroappetens]|uniref:Uncharacterized protein n=1 Tax=Symbiodinium necroappetens TaxID=1628268 RepID=A0A812RMK9_9DINO|nr:unnamed protein product [Symbiodinium necroappetens]